MASTGQIAHMTTWYSKDVDGVSAPGQSTLAQEGYLALARAGKTTFDMGVFSFHDLQRNVVTLYFSPTLSTLAASFGASPCSMPVPKRGFSLLVGDHRNWEIHFPGYAPGA